MYHMPRLKTKVFLAVILVSVALGYLFHLEIAHHTKTLYHTTVKTPEAPKHHAQEFWRQVFKAIDKCRPDAYRARLRAEKKGQAPDEVIRFNSDSPRWSDLSKVALDENYEIEDEIVSDFKRKHELFMGIFPTELSPYAYKEGSSGIVIIGGGKYSWLGYMALKNLRNLGSALPVEFILPTSNDYDLEKHLCENILPKLNAKCVLVSEILGPLVSKSWKFKSYQYKSLALVASSFQNVLMLDSDNFVMCNPDYLLKSELFREKGLITWPDYWRRQISPKWYDIVGVEVNNNRRVRYNRVPLKTSPGDNVSDEEADLIPYHEMEGSIPDMSTESGQLAINKKTHSKTILLSLYYNAYGPGLYYRMFSQGQAGEGDKDTFIAAAHVVKDSYYQVHTGIGTSGYFDSNGDFHGVAMAQAEPVEDYQLFLRFNPVEPSGEESIGSPKLNAADKLIDQSFSPDRKPKKLFAMHCNFPKLDPVELSMPDDRYNEYDNRLNYKFYGDLTVEKPRSDGTIEVVDFELDKYQIMEEALCQEKLRFPHMAEMDPDIACEFAKNQVAFVKQSKMKKD
ncbi:alpha-1,2-mannosyltransferase Mnn2p [Diutina catenulata]